MKIDSTMIEAYLEDRKDYREHWIFSHIKEDDYCFEEPPAHLKAEVRKLDFDLTSTLASFRPLNEEYFSLLFPNWRTYEKAVNVIFVVGCPSPFDAMVREYEGVEYIIFDLIRFLDMKNMGYHPVDFAKSMMTHELIHICLHGNLPFILPSENFLEKETLSPYQYELAYLVFDEGFAHLLSLTEGIEHYDFNKLLEAHSLKSLSRLKEAYKETNTERQRNFLEEANSGAYKFGAIAGLLHLGKNFNSLLDIYKKGPEKMLEEILIEA